MSRCSCTVICLLLGVGAASTVTPVQKVITLLENLKSDVEGEGTTEAKTYDDFACFCKDMTKTKSGSITSGRDTIGILSTEIEEKTALKNKKTSELTERKSKQEATAAELKETEVRCTKAEADYTATAAHLDKAISSLSSAIEALESSKPAPASFLAIRKSVERSLVLADALNLIPEPKRKSVVAFLQQHVGVDPADPEYKYHSAGIISTLDKLLKDFTAEKSDVDAEWGKTSATCSSTISSLQGDLKENKEAMDALEEAIDGLNGEIARAREDLENTDSILKDDQLYLKDLTKRCEDRANDWDQRSQLRAGELGALTSALAILKGNVSSLDVDVNERALVQMRAKTAHLPASMRTVRAHGAGVVGAGPRGGAAVLSFLQGASMTSGRGGARLGASMQVKKDRVAAVLRSEGRRLGSVALTSLAASVAADPFTKVKTLIQRLIERLLKEATSEATKKGFCDEELGKAESDRDFRHAEMKKLNGELSSLEVKRDELDQEMTLLTGEIQDLTQDLTSATEIRQEDKGSNLDTLKKAKEGLVALTEALNILKVFYKEAAKAKVLLQASPVDEDTSGAGFQGAYAGKQEKSEGIIGLLQVIKTDFERTVRRTEAAEAKAHAEFIKFDRTSKSDISGKDTKKMLNEEDFNTTKTTIGRKMDDMTTAMGLLDTALERLVELKPMCIDTGMSYAERVEKREEEIEALKKAMCILDTDGVEEGC